MTTTPVWAHRRLVGFGFDTAEHGDSNGFALTMAFFIGAMIVALLGALFYFRWRAAHPLPEPDSVRAVLEIPEGATETPRSAEKSGDDWERPADWWKSEHEDEN